MLNLDVCMLLYVHCQLEVRGLAAANAAFLLHVAQLSVLQNLLFEHNEIRPLFPYECAY